MERNHRATCERRGEGRISLRFFNEEAVTIRCQGDEVKVRQVTRRIANMPENAKKAKKTGIFI